MLIGRRILRLDVVDSTNEYAKQLLEEDTEEGTVIVARRQASGRGRHGRAWASPIGGLYGSLVLRPTSQDSHLLGLLAGIPVTESLRRWGVKARLRWPNDIVVGGRKLGGLLSDGVHRGGAYFVVLGIGLNTNVELSKLPKAVQEEATTLKREVRGEVENEEVLRALIDEFEPFYGLYRQGRQNELLARYRALCTTLGKSIEVRPGGRRYTAKALDVDDRGFLVIEHQGKREMLSDATVVELGGT